MKIQESKEKLKKDGYTSFNLKDFNKEFYDLLLPFKCNEDINLKKLFKGLRADCYNKSIKKDTYDSFEEAEAEKNEIVNLYMKTNSTSNMFDQIYYQYHFSQIFEQVMHRVYEENNNIINNIINVVKHYFDLNEYLNLKHITYFTYYDNDCFLANHSDGIQKDRVCAILIYLNEPYDVEDGGCLILDGKEIVVPKFGNVAIIDLENFDVPHQVTKVTGGFGRYAIVSFISKQPKPI
jgi:Rps23 Pro-64 3,4-dihydroxylase Tpa1-like proline 4-hydroxylase